MHDMSDTREMCEARKSRSSRACRASSRDPCMRDVWGIPRPADLRACEASDPAGHYIYVTVRSGCAPQARFSDLCHPHPRTSPAFAPFALVSYHPWSSLVKTR
jgi:hypothetical protein